MSRESGCGRPQCTVPKPASYSRVGSLPAFLRGMISFPVGLVKERYEGGETNVFTILGMKPGRESVRGKEVRVEAI